MTSSLHSNLSSVIQVSILSIFSFYSFFFARNIDSIGNSVLLAMSVICLVALINIRLNLYFLRPSLFYISIFFTLCILSIIFPLWPDTDPSWTYSAVCKCVLGLPIVLIFKVQNNHRTCKIFLLIFFLLCFLMILQNTGFGIKETLNSSLFNCTITDWNEKHHTFWLVILFWPMMYSIENLSRYNRFLAVFFFLFALISSYSESAKAAIIFSFIIFFISKAKPVVTWAIVYKAIYMYILLFPIVSQILPISELDSANDRLYIRFLLWEVASNVISEELIFGRGFGSTLSIDIIPYLPEHHSNAREWLVTFRTFPGNHPHNFVALIWIEFGLIGAIMLIFFLYRFNCFIAKIIKHSDAAPYIISLITTIVILFSCSWSIWQTDVVLTYIMFIACLSLLITTGKSNQGNFIECS